MAEGLAVTAPERPRVRMGRHYWEVKSQYGLTHFYLWDDAIWFAQHASRPSTGTPVFYDSVWESRVARGM